MLFYGQMGVGKTTLIKKIASFLAVEDLVTSPTFSIINEYRTTTQDIIYHFDFYRVKDENEVYNLGYEHYFSSKAYCFIEWPEKIPNLTDNNMIKIYMELDGNNRIINVKK